MSKARKAGAAKAPSAAQPLLDGGHPLDEHNLRRRVMNQLVLYARERNGLLIWRAYRVCRASGARVPESILAKFDEWAARLESASGARAIAQVIEMTGPRGGPQGAKHLLKVERQRHIVSAVAFYMALGMTRANAQQRAADELRLTVAAVKSACARWATGTKQRAPAGEASASRTLRLLGSGK